ncbi:hypothetical protein [Acidocella sp.]|uniref:hypothetical protein n=1 Tax=Acidocella sp. TaxID=50710 RepID=UPI002637FD9B|nr:hypothetical protein [Acidocella sp.]
MTTEEYRRGRVEEALDALKTRVDRIESTTAAKLAELERVMNAGFLHGQRDREKGNEKIGDMLKELETTMLARYERLAATINEWKGGFKLSTFLAILVGGIISGIISHFL